MALINEGGKLLIQNGALASGAGCCCGGGPCDPATCPNGTECQPPCVCVDGECVQAPGACCINGSCDLSYATQEECESCETVNQCYEYLYLEDPEQPCPEGWQGGGGWCSRSTTPESCGDCQGECYPQQIGPCGKWIPDSTSCDESPQCDGVDVIYICGIPGGFDTPGAGGVTPGKRWTFQGVLVVGGEVSGLTPPATIAWGFAKDPFSNTYTSSSPVYAGSLSVQCGRWVYSWADFPTNPCLWASMSLTVDMGPAGPDGCLPSGGSGIAYWSAVNCDLNSPNYGQAISGSLPVTLSASTDPSC
jgi:hypothetical protein